MPRLGTGVREILQYADAQPWRALLAAGGEPGILRWQDHQTRPRRVVLLLDIALSGTARGDNDNASRAALALSLDRPIRPRGKKHHLKQQEQKNQDSYKNEHQNIPMLRHRHQRK
jgi:hypothetical protein